MSGNSYNSLVSQRLVAERKQDVLQLEKSEANWIARRKTFQQAATWLETCLICAIDAAVVSSGGRFSVDCQNNLAADGHDAYKNPQVAFAIRSRDGQTRADYEVVIAHGLITLNRISNHLRRQIVTPGFSGPQLVALAGHDLARAMVSRAVEESMVGGGA